jgi:signal transduction histidine kinase
MHKIPAASTAIAVACAIAPSARADSSADLKNAPDLEAALRTERIRALYSKLFVPLAVVVINAAILVSVLWDVVTDHASILLWLAVVVLISLLRAGLALRFRRVAPGVNEVPRWETLFAIGVALSGVSWGAAGLVLFAPESVAHQVFLVFVLGGMVAGATTSLSSHILMFALYAIPTLLPVAIRLVVEGGRMHLAMAALTIIFGTAMTAIARSGGRALTNAERLRIRNAKLVGRLNSAREGLAASNVELKRHIAEVRESQALLKAAASRQRAILQALPDMMFVLSRDGTVLDFYSHDADQLYRPPSELLGKSIRETMPPGFVEGAMSHIAEAFDTRSLQRWEYELEVASGVRQYEARMAICADDQALTLVRDVTESKKLQADLLDTERRRLASETEAHLLQASRMAALGTLAAGVAYEINTPLAYVIVNLDYLETALDKMMQRREDATAAEIHSLTRECREGCRRVESTVRDLMRFSRDDEEVEWESVNVQDVLDFAIKLVANQIRHRARLVKRYERVPPIRANDARLAQLFVNLLVITAQSIPEGHASKNEIRVTIAMDASEMVAIEIDDSGGGIPAGDIARLFEPFSTTEAPGGGTGLGPSNCNSITLDLGGRIDVDSEVGRGPRFRVLLPTDDAATEPAEDAMAPVEPTADPATAERERRHGPRLLASGREHLKRAVHLFSSHMI